MNKIKYCRDGNLPLLRAAIRGVSSTRGSSIAFEEEEGGGKKINCTARRNTSKKTKIQ